MLLIDLFDVSSVERVKDGLRVRLKILPPSVSRISKENVGASTSHNRMGLHGLFNDNFNFTLDLYLSPSWIFRIVFVLDDLQLLHISRGNTFPCWSSVQ
jgi:hypothetical protein